LRERAAPVTKLSTNSARRSSAGSGRLDDGLQFGSLLDDALADDGV
jgi:hypothetical protein